MQFDGWEFKAEKMSYVKWEGLKTVIVGRFDGYNWGYLIHEKGVILRGRMHYSMSCEDSIREAETALAP